MMTMTQLAKWPNDDPNYPNDDNDDWAPGAVAVLPPSPSFAPASGRFFTGILYSTIIEIVTGIILMLVIIINYAHAQCSCFRKVLHRYLVFHDHCNHHRNYSHVNHNFAHAHASGRFFTGILSSTVNKIIMIIMLIIIMLMLMLQEGSSQVMLRKEIKI